MKGEIIMTITNEKQKAAAIHEAILDCLRSADDSGLLLDNFTEASNYLLRTFRRAFAEEINEAYQRGQSEFAVFKARFKPYCLEQLVNDIAHIKGYDQMTMTDVDIFNQSMLVVFREMQRVYRKD